MMRGQEWEVRSWWRSECILVGKFDAQKSQYSFKGGIGHKHLQYVDDDGLRHLRCDLWRRSECCILGGKFGAQKSYYRYKDGRGH